MKKLGLICLLAVVLASPSLASAQTVTQEEINAQIQVILNQLLAQVQELMAKLIAMQTKQGEDSQKIGAIQSSVQILNTNVGAVSQTVSAPTPIEFTAIRDAQTVFTKCLSTTAGNDGVSVTIGNLHLTPKNTTNKEIKIKAHVDVTGQGNFLFQQYNGGGQEHSIISSAGKNEFNLTTKTGTELYFWAKEVKKPMGFKLTVDSATSDDVEVLGLPIEFETVGVVSCQ
jgi:hypothetical protein